MEINVTNSNDSGAGSLRQAIATANSNPGTDTITFASSLAGQTINLSSGELTITDEVTIDGLGASQLTVDGNYNSRIFNINDGTNQEIAVAIEGLTITEGGSFDYDYDDGGGIYNQENLTITNSTISDNYGGAGGGIFSDGTLTVNNSLISGNEGANGVGIYSNGTLTVNNSDISANYSAYGSGGGIMARGNVTISNSTISSNGADEGGGMIVDGAVTINNSSITNNYAADMDRGGGIIANGDVTINNSSINNNSAFRDGGGIYNQGDLTVMNSTISGNTAGYFDYYGFGGGVFNQGNLTVINSTISDNAAYLGGGAIYSNAFSNELNITNTTIYNNSNGYGYYNYSSTGGIDGEANLNLANSIVAGNETRNIGENITLNDRGGNLIDVANPGLGPLADNGGPTLTHALLPNSPAINAGVNSLIPTELTTDQRGAGFSRVSDGRVDIGSFEVQTNSSNPTITLRVNPASVSEDGSNNLVYTFSRSGSTTNPLIVNFNVQGTASLGTDYTQAGGQTFNSTIGTIKFNAGSSNAILTIDPKADALVEANETVKLSLTPGSGYEVGTTATATGTILNDDSLPVLAFSQANYSANEGNGTGPLNQVIATLTRTGNTSGVTTVPVILANSPGTATAGTDYTNNFPISVTFSPGQTTRSVVLPIVRDNNYEANETINLKLGTPSGATLGASKTATFTILNDDAPPSLSINDVQVVEGANAQAILTVSLSAPISETVTVNYATANGTAIANADYLSKSGVLTFNGGETSKTIAVSLVNNDLSELDESFRVNLSNPSANATVSKSQGLATISDTLLSAVTTTLNGQVENLTLIGTGSINGTGNNQSNIIQGNSRANVLTGEKGNDQLLGNGGSDTLRGGPGDDLLSGGSGVDFFNYNSGAIYNRANFGLDSLSDFTSQDKLLLSKNTFRALASSVGNGLSVLTDLAVVGSDAQVANSGAALVFSSASHTLFYNQNRASNGLGTGDALAVLSGVNNLTANNLVLEV